MTSSLRHDQLARSLSQEATELVIFPMCKKNAHQLSEINPAQSTAIVLTSPTDIVFELKEISF